ncbi:hypothetical protein PV328_004240 [Microctonus aethiopoides]|uniref:Uncharacterized protein n=1 Tax=Microctonus aethiopoides TaxID=144406 RepID=A0AA39KLD0_9HYME|nr:hypothetical protein PV328_004240 [Microctonus aethiopoides]
MVIYNVSRLESRSFLAKSEICDQGVAEVHYISDEEKNDHPALIHTIFFRRCDEQNVKKLREEVFLAYFQGKAKGLKSSTLWSTYSSLKSTIIIKNNIDLSKFGDNVISLAPPNDSGSL